MGLALAKALPADGYYRPRPGTSHNWHVHCTDGALEVIRRGEYQQWLADHQGGVYSVAFVDSTSALVHPGHPLWEALRGVAALCMVGVFPLSLRRYMRWTGADRDPCQFNCIKIALAF